MKIEDFDVAAGLVYRIDKLEKTIFKLNDLKINSNKFKIIGENSMEINFNKIEIELNTGDISTEVFSQDILEYFINTLNLELNEMRDNFNELFPNKNGNI